MFYDEISEYYDQMIPLDKRVATYKNQLRDIVSKHGITTALDAGSATGATCIALSGLGVKAFGIESSRKMILAAGKNCREYGLRIPFKRADLTDRQPDLDGMFEAVFCLSNTISHFLNMKSLNKVLTNFRKWLVPGGILVIQLLNYDRIIREHERIVKIYNNNERIFIRFYDFKKSKLDFNILVVENTPGICRHSYHSLPIRGWRPGEITSALKNRNFRNIKKYSDFCGNRFGPSRATDIIFVCRSAQ